MEAQTVETRVKLSINLNAKGLVQFDITSEFSNLNDAAKNLSEAVDMVKKITAEKGFKLAGE